MKLLVEHIKTLTSYTFMTSLDDESNLIYSTAYILKYNWGYMSQHSIDTYFKMYSWCNSVLNRIEQGLYLFCGYMKDLDFVPLIPTSIENIDDNITKKESILSRIELMDVDMSICTDDVALQLLLHIQDFSNKEGLYGYVSNISVSDSLKWFVVLTYLRTAYQLERDSFDLPSYTKLLVTSEKFNFSNCMDTFYGLLKNIWDLES